MSFFSKKRLAIPCLVILVFSVFDLLVAHSVDFRHRVQSVLWNPSDDLKALLDSLDQGPYTVVSADIGEYSRYTVELQTIHFWLTYTRSDDFIVLYHSSQEWLYFSSKEGIYASPYVNILKYLEPPMLTGCLGDLEVSYVDTDNRIDYQPFLVLDEGAYFVGVNSLIESKFSEGRCAVVR